jgi:hypothetical protein
MAATGAPSGSADWIALVQQGAEEGGQWLDVTLDEVDVLTRTEHDREHEIPSDVLQEKLVELLQRLYDLKAQYRLWLASRNTYDVSADAAARERANRAMQEAACGEQDNVGSVWSTYPLFKMYRDLMGETPALMWLPGAVLHCVVKATAGPQAENHGKRYRPSVESLRGISFTVDGEPAPWVVRDTMAVDDNDDFGLRVTRAAIKLEIAIEKEISSHIAENPKSGYTFALATRRVPRYNARPWAYFERNALILAQVPRLVGQGGLPVQPELSAIERGIRDTELLSFTDMERKKFHMINQLLRLEELVQSFPMEAGLTGRHRWRFTSRRYLRTIPSFILPQVCSAC